MLPLRRTLTVLVLVSVILTTLTPAPLLGQPAAQTPLPPAEATLSASAAPEKPETPETPPQYLARLAPEADREALEAFLTELRAQEQIGAFQWLAEPQAFLITGEKGLALVIARPEVREILEATPEALALPPLAAESPAEEKARLERTAATEAAEAPPDAVTKIGDVFLLRLVAPETRETLDAAYARLGFDLNYLQQKGELGAYRWLPEANAVQVEILVPQAVDFLRRLADVADLVPWEDTALEQAQAEQEAVLQALTRAAPRAPAHIMAYTPTTPTVAAQLYNNYLSLTSDTDAAAVFTLTTATGAVKNDPTMSYLYWYSLTDGYGGYAYLYDADSNAISMLPGDILYVAQAGRAPFSMTLPRLTAYANAAANTVTGVAPSNISSTDPITPPALLVSMFTSQYVTTTATGDYLADNVGDFDPADSGLIRYYDTHGNQTYRNLRAPAVGLRGWNNWSNNDRVMGYVPTAAAFVAITLRRGGAAIATSGTTAGSDGYFSLYLSETIEGGDIVEVITDDWGATIAAPNFTVLSNPETDTLTGATDAVVVTTTYGAFQTLAAWPTSYYDSNPGQYVQPDGDGDFSAANPFYYNANSSGGDVTLDWSWGATGHLRYVDENGNRTYFRFKAPSPPP
ncbi:MAG TPA: hypothetical protein PKH77_28770, partial [Anaerolineae bacterium]|nr:hypothetical protein [Anaerolineae bacterium]